MAGTRSVLFSGLIAIARVAPLLPPYLAVLLPAQLSTFKSNFYAQSCLLQFYLKLSSSKTSCKV
eukprot:5483661-Amphidinium_carterae.1